MLMSWCELWMWKTNWKTYNSSFFGLSQRQLKRSKKKTIGKNFRPFEIEFLLLSSCHFQPFQIDRKLLCKKNRFQIEIHDFYRNLRFYILKKISSLDLTKPHFTRQRRRRYKDYLFWWTFQQTDYRIEICLLHMFRHFKLPYLLYVAIKLIAFHRNVSPPQFMVWLHLIIKPKPIC